MCADMLRIALADTSQPPPIPRLANRSVSFGGELTSASAYIELDTCSSEGAATMDSLVALASEGLGRCVHPLRVEDCLSGTYFLRDASRRVCLVFKPAEEERECRGGAPGGGMMREFVAYLLDGGLAGVPPTALVRLAYPATYRATVVEGMLDFCKRGSVQRYVRSECSADDMGASRFLTDDVHRIACLDLRLCNLDRHAGNILVVLPRSCCVCPSEDAPLSQSAPLPSDLTARMHEEQQTSETRLVPIDHGCVLPPLLALDDAHFAWLHWPQASLPLSAELRLLVEGIDIEEDVRLTRLIAGDAIPEDCLLTLRICTHLLKHGAALGLTPRQMGELLTAGEGEEEEQASDGTKGCDYRRSPLQRLVVEEVLQLAADKQWSPRSVTLLETRVLEAAEVQTALAILLEEGHANALAASLCAAVDRMLLALARPGCSC